MDAVCCITTRPGYTWSIENPNAKAGRPDRETVRLSQPLRLRVCRLLGCPSKARAEIQSVALALDEPIDGVWASDHFGVLVDLKVGNDG
jgi:hypothetical protein